MEEKQTDRTGEESRKNQEPQEVLKFSEGEGGQKVQEPREDYRKQKNYENQENYKSGKNDENQGSHRGQDDYRKQEDFRNQNGYGKQDGHGNQEDYGRQDGYGNQKDSRNQNVYEKQDGHGNQESYGNQNGYGNLEDYRKQNNYEKQNDYRYQEKDGKEEEQKKSKKWIPVLTAVLLIFLAGVSIVGWEMVKRFLPSKEQADLGEVLDVSGEETAIFLNDQLEEAKGITRDGQTYFPIEWVNERINEKFYWDDVEKLLVYTLPDTIVYADKRTEGSTGIPLLLAEEDGIYLSAGLINNYTAVEIKNYNNEIYKRIYLDNRWEPRQIGTAKKKTAVRVENNIKSPILTYVEKKGNFVILEQSEDWAKIRTEDGYIGYIKNKAVKNVETVQNPCTMELPEYTNISMDEKICLVWHQVTVEEANDVMERLIADTKGVNVIVPTWFALTDNKGNYHSFASRDYVEKAHALGMQVWVALDNFNMGDDVNSEILFARTSVRKDLIANLMDDVEKYDLDGINLDIEGIKPAAGPHYVQFIRELSVSCRKEGIILSIDNYTPSPSSAFYNRAEQGRVADYVIIMGYDEHYAGGEAGSVASYPYVKEGIEKTLELVPHEKVIGAIPFFTRVWTEKEDKTTSSALGIGGAKKWVEENDVELYWQEELGQYYGELKTEEGLKQIWMEEETSLSLKMDLIRDYDLAGVGCWKLGLETASIWDVVKVDEGQGR